MDFVSIRPHIRYTLSFLLLLGVFLFLRLYKLPSTLEFMADMGRDHNVLMNWKLSGKPPLLGPSNSALPMNQSPIYFYALYPVFLLTQASPYASVIATLTYAVILMSIGAYLLRNSVYRWRYLAVVLALGLHPQVVIQLRSPWNPSFGFLFFLTSLLLVLIPDLSRKRWSSYIAAVSLVVAVGSTYSLIPSAIIVTLLACFTWKKQLLFVFSGYITGFCLVFFPLIFFEIRNHFFFFNRLLMDHSFAGGKSLGMMSNLWEAMRLVSGSTSPIVLLMIGALLLKSVFRKEVILFLIILLCTVTAPIQMAPHYIFGILGSFLALFFFLPRRSLVVLLSICLFAWLQPSWFEKYLAPIHRSIQEMEACAERVCRLEQGPMYLTQQSWYSYHYAPEYLFFFSKYGCTVQDIGFAKPGFSSTMALVVDHSSYEHGKTDFYELSRFGASKVVRSHACSNTLKVVILQK